MGPAFYPSPLIVKRANQTAQITESKEIQKEISEERKKPKILFSFETLRIFKII